MAIHRPGGPGADRGGCVMNPQSLRDPHVDNAIATAAASPDPIVELARKHRAAIDLQTVPGKLSDDEATDLLLNVILPLEEKLARTRPTTREGIIAALDVAARQERAQHGESSGGTNAMVIGILENARDALKAGVGMAQETDPDPLVALWAEWCALEWHKRPKGLTDEESERFTEQAADQADKIATKIISASPDTLAGAFAQIALLSYWSDNAVPYHCIAALKRLDSRVASILQNAAGHRGAS